MSHRIRTFLAAFAIAAAALAAYENSFHGPFIYDDPKAIPENASIRHFPSLDNLKPPRASTVARRPVANLTLAINQAIGGPGVRGFHAGNLLIHIAAALTLFGVVKRTMDDGRWTIRPREIVRRPSSIAAFAVALLWAIHPLQTESVTYIVQRVESLAGLFYLLTLYCAIRGASSERPWRWYSCAIVACAMGMGTKEIVATAPVLVLLYDRCFLSGSFRAALRRRAGLYLGLAATWAVLGALMIAYPQGEGSGAGFGLQGVAPWQYARTQPGVILHYLALSFRPRGLCLDYCWPIATTAREIVPAALAVAALLAATVWALRRAPVWGFLGAWFFLILAPTSSIVPILDPCFEHRMYLPLAAIVAASVAAACWIGERCLRRAVRSDATRRLVGACGGAAALLAVAITLGCLTHERNADYRDGISIWKDTTAKAEKNPRAWNNLGEHYLNARRLDEALDCFNKSIELKPEAPHAYFNRGQVRVKEERFAEAAFEFSEAIAHEPKFALAYANRAAAYERLKEYRKAAADLRTLQRLGGHPPPGAIEALTRKAAEQTE